MEFVPTKIAGAYEIRLKAHVDPRGRFARHYCEREFAEAGLETRWVQMNHSVTYGRGSLRGLHYQRAPAAEDKLVSCTVGRVFDVAVDVRRGSPTFLQWFGVELDETKMLYVPKGCAHGFQALDDEIHLVYMASAEYTPSAEAGLRFDDPAVGVDWPLPVGTMSDRDLAFPLVGEAFRGISV